MFKSFAAAVAAVFLISTSCAYAATTGIVRGLVTLANKPVPNASVTLSGEGSTFTTTSGGDGTFRFTEVPFGHYHLVAHKDGTPDRTYDIDVTSDTVATVDVSLDQLREIANTTVTAHAGAGGNPVAVDTITKAQIATSPNRDSLNKLIETLPGVVRFSYNEPVIHGFHGISYEIDGAPLPLATTSNFGEIIDPKSLDSLEVYTGAFPAEYGGSRMGGLVNLVSQRLSSLPVGSYGHLTVGGGEAATSLVSLDELARFKNSEIYFSANGSRNNRGIDAPTYNAIHDDSSRSDQFLRYVLKMGDRTTLAADFSNSLAQFQIPINTDPNNLIAPVVAVPGTDDVQREYDRFANLSLTATSRDGNGIFQLIPWVRSTRIAYEGDLASDVLALAPNSNFGNAGAMTAACQNGLPPCPVLANQIGLRQDRRANYAGIRISDFRASDHHAWKVGIDASREFFNATQTFACYDPTCNTAPETPFPVPPAPGYYTINSTQNQPGTLVGIYAQDKWQPTRDFAVNYGIRYDHSTGYTNGWMLEPRLGLNYAYDAKNVFHAYYGRTYAAPQLEDVRQDCILLNGCSGTVPYDLQPERDAYWEFGVAHTFGGHLKGSWNYFQRSVSNILDTQQLLNTPLFAVFNNAIGIDKGIEIKLENQLHSGDSWYLSGTLSGSYAGGISGSTFLFPTNTSGLSPTDPAGLAPEDHDQTVAGTASYTHRFGKDASWFGTLEADYGTGYPVTFQNVVSPIPVSYSGRLNAHTTLNLSLGREASLHGLGMSLDVQNLLNHQYILKIANGFNTTQISQGRVITLRLTAPF